MKGAIPVIAGLLLSFSPASANADVSAGLAAYYPFSGNANDQSGNGNNGTVFGAVLGADRFGSANSAYSFDGTNDYVRIPHSESLNITGDLTIGAWIRTGSAGRIIFSNMQETSPHYGYSLRVSWDGNLQFMAGDKILLGDTPVNTDRWTHVAATLSGQTATIYIDGVPNVTGTVGIPTSSWLDETIGASDTPYYFWNGSMDEVRVYNRALSSAEIGELYSLPEPTTLLLLGIGAAGMAGRGWQRREKTGRN